MGYKKALYFKFLIAIVVAGILTNGVMYQLYAYREHAVIRAETTQRLNQTIHYVEQHLDLIYTIGNVIWISDRVQSLRNASPERVGYFEYMELQEYMENFALSVNSIHSVHVYFLQSDVLVTSNNGVFYRTNEELQKYYKACMEDAEEKQWVYDYPRVDIPYMPKEKVAFSYMCPVYSTESNTKVGLVVIQVKDTAIENVIEKEEGLKAFYVLSPEGEVIHESLDNGFAPESIDNVGIFEEIEKEGVGSKTVKYGKEKYTCFYNASDYNDWIYVAVYQERSPILFSGLVVLYFICIVALYSGVFGLIVWISGREVGKPVDTLTYAMKQAQNGNFDYRISEDRNDEMGYIYHRFNHMMQHIQALVDEVVEERLKKKDVEYKLLQTQINPHFIFNIFNNMIWLLQQEKYEELEDIIEATAGYYKTSLNYGNIDICVKDVEAQLNWYAAIQKIRFGDLFDCSIEFEPEILEYMMPNLLLQPLLENAIVHGASDKEGTTFISVTGKRVEGYMEFKVLDDGVGVSKEHLERIREVMKQENYEGGDFFALSNIARRISMYYKTDAGLTIDSECGVWTEVTLKIPLEDISEG